MANGDVIRSESLHVFADEEVARRYWTFKSNRYLYQLCVKEADIAHRGDMNLINRAAEFTGKLEDVKDLVERYCRGDKGDNPRIELMVKKARVTAIIKTPGEKQAEFNKRYRRASQEHLTNEELDKIILGGEDGREKTS